MKKLIPFAVLCAAGAAAHAQSSVQIYGAVDVYVGVQKATGNSGTRKVVDSGMNPNSFGFTGTEDLGGGLKAGFTLESQPQLDTGTLAAGGGMWGRQSLVFISGGWGRLGLGRQHMPTRAFGVKYSPTGWLTTDPFGALEIAQGSTLAATMNGNAIGGRFNNSVLYTSPVFGGLSVSAAQTAAEGGTFNAGQSKVSILSANWANSMFEADVVWSRIPGITGSQTPQTDIGVGGVWKAPFARVLVAYQQKRGYSVAATGATAAAGSNIAIAGTQGTDRLFSVGAQFPLAGGTAGTVGVGVAKLDRAGVHKGLGQGNSVTGGVADDAKAWGLSYSYPLSKRTTLFATYGSVSNDGFGRAAIGSGNTPTAGGDSRMAGAGLRHAF